ncbi:MAG: S41 family peptidase [Candidatus Saccharimonadales bacterium]
MKDKKTFLRGFGLAIITVGIFSLGVNVGNGRINVSQSRFFSSSVQKNAPSKLDYSSVDEVYQKLRNGFNGQLDNQKLLDGLKSGLVSAAGDPFTEFMNGTEAKQFNGQLDGTFTGIGAELGKDAKGNIVVIAPISGFPAQKAGLKPNDIIAEIDGKTTAGMTLGDAVTNIRGAENTHVKLKIIRSESQEINFDIIRSQISIPSVDSKIIDGNIGYIKISRFGEDTSGLASAAADSFKKAGVKGVIVDVRSNPGGLLNSAVDVSSLWLESGKTILQEKRADVVVETYKSSGTATLKGIPTVVLIDDGSASASEILAGALHDNGAAKLIGIKSFGKGSVQKVEQLSGGGILKVTVALWYTPNGININKAGIKPDKEVKMTADDVTARRDPQLDAAKASL